MQFLYKAGFESGLRLCLNCFPLPLKFFLTSYPFMVGKNGISILFLHYKLGLSNLRHFPIGVDLFRVVGIVAVVGGVFQQVPFTAIDKQVETTE